MAVVPGNGILQLVAVGAMGTVGAVLLNRFVVTDNAFLSFVLTGAGIGLGIYAGVHLGLINGVSKGTKLTAVA